MRILFLVLTALFGFGNLFFAYLNLFGGGSLYVGIFNLVVGVVLLIEHGILLAMGDDF